MCSSDLASFLTLFPYLPVIFFAATVPTPMRAAAITLWVVLFPNNVGQMAAFGFVQRALWQDGRLLATYKEGRARLNAYLDDHAFLLLAALELLQARFDAGTLRFAQSLAQAMLARFADPAGGFYFTADDHETLIARMKPLADNATPSGNGVAALALGRLSVVTGELAYAEAARAAVVAAMPAMRDTPAAHATLLMALAETLSPPRSVVLQGEAAPLAGWRSRLGGRYLPEIGRAHV